MDLQDFLRTLTILELIRINGYGLYGLIGAMMGCVVLLPKSFPEFAVRMTCGFVFSFTLTPLAGPLLGGIVEANLGPRAAEHLYEAPAGVGVLVGMLSYFAASFVLHVARHSRDHVLTNRTTIHDIRERNRPDQSSYTPPSPFPPSPPTPPTPPTPPRSTDSLPWPDPNPSPNPNNRDADVWSL